MIAVIADDFTGAAEIGGIGLRYGLSVVIETENIQHHNTDLLIIATDTRSLSAQEAGEQIFKVTKELQKLKPELIFKKIDSVLRGNIAEELIAQMKAESKSRAIVVAANPVFLRTIQEGIYYIDGVPLKDTFFSTDPEFPVISSSVVEIIGNQKVKVKNLKAEDSLPIDGIIVGDVTNNSDLAKWTNLIDSNTLLAGASGFFEALLQCRGLNQKQNISQNIDLGKKTLYVFGSLYPKDVDFLEKLESMGIVQLNMPEDIYRHQNIDLHLLESWAKDIIEIIEQRHKVIVSISGELCSDPEVTSRIKESVGLLAQTIASQVSLNELMIEGGATTSTVLKKLDINTLFPFQELDTGVIRMKIEGKPNLCLTTKPGSYQWPDNVWYPKTLNYTPNN
jgi:uncharacterized protein YgbK (DUF1537 family)